MSSVRALLLELLACGKLFFRAGKSDFADIVSAVKTRQLITATVKIKAVYACIGSAVFSSFFMRY